MSIQLLSKRENEVLTLLAQGNQNKELARKLNITEGTIEQHLKKIYKKLEVSNRVEAATLFWRIKIESTQRE